MRIPRATGVRRRLVTGWAGLCLAGLAATFALDSEPYTGDTEHPAGEPTAGGSYTLACREFADHVEQARAEARRKLPEPVDSAPPAAYQSVIVGDMAVPEGCAGELAAVPAR